MATQSSLIQKAKFLPDNVRINMVRMDAKDMVHSAALGEVLYTVIESDAKTHGASFNSKNFGNVLNAIRRDKVQAYFVVLEKDEGLPRFGGGAIQFPTVLTYWNGTAFDHFPALYREDIFVSPEMSTEFKSWTKSEIFPNGVGLGAYLTHEEIRDAVMGTTDNRPFGMVAHGLLGEYAPDNEPIIRSLGKLGSNLGKGANSAVLYFPDPMLMTAQNEGPSVQIMPLAPIGTTTVDPCKNIFTVLWTSADKQQQIVASFTEALSTFNGETVVRVQITSNEVLPENKTLKQVLKAIILEGNKEIAKRGWGPTEDIDLIGLMRFHALQEPEIIFALKSMGATPRFLGSHVMQPITLRFQDIPKDMVSFKVPQASPMLVLASQDDFCQDKTIEVAEPSRAYMVA